MTAVGYPALGACGRFGNQVCQILGTVGIARWKALPVSLPPWPYAPFFNLPADWFTPHQRIKSADRFITGMDPRARPYMQDRSLWLYAEQELRDAFTLSPEGVDLLGVHLDRTEQDDLPDLLAEPTTIALHVRRGDNADPVTHPPGTWPLVTLDYYDAAIAQLDPEMESEIVVFSDDMAWCNQNLPYACRLTLPGPTRPPEQDAYDASPPHDWIDCWLMSLAPKIVTGNSSYSWLAAWLSGSAEVTWPDPWVGHLLSGWVKPELLADPRWHKIPNPVGPEHLAPC